MDSKRTSLQGRTKYKGRTFHSSEFTLRISLFSFRKRAGPSAPGPGGPAGLVGGLADHPVTSRSIWPDSLFAFHTSEFTLQFSREGRGVARPVGWALGLAGMQIARATFVRSSVKRRRQGRRQTGRRSRRDTSAPDDARHRCKGSASLR